MTRACLFFFIHKTVRCTQSYVPFPYAYVSFFGYVYILQSACWYMSEKITAEKRHVCNSVLVCIILIAQVIADCTVAKQIC